jgi:hypothetical protein
MAYLVGVFLALGVAVFTRLAGFDRDRFYPTILVVIASYYLLL